MEEKDMLMKELDTPTLTFEPFAEEPKEKAPVIETPVKRYEEEEMLTPQELKQVEAFAERIELNNTTMILQYGAGAQKKIADFSEKALESVKTKDLGEVGEMLSGLVTELKDFDSEEEESRGFFGLFRKTENKLTAMKAKYEKAEVNVNKIVEALESHQIQLMKDVAMLDQMYKLNQNYFKELSMYILAGKKKIEQARVSELTMLKAKAQQTGLQEDAQEASDYAAKIDRFEKKIHDLELTRMVAMQMAPQIRLVQNNDTLMTEKIQSTIVNTIPLWKNQMLIAMGVEHSGQAAKASKEVSDMTNELLKRNAAKLKLATTETMRESERGIVDMQTLAQTNAALIETIDEVMRIQNEGREKRRQAEQELLAMEQQMKAKLLEISR
ncbi:MAG: toxic anion resistance protein [Lachnospiraceae bacterium]|nr:toxic anion resistance protein [Lachnospiraceae bacterium]